MEWNPFAVAFGRALREIRRSKRITLYGFAGKTGVNSSFCSAVERANFSTHSGSTYDSRFIGSCFAQGLNLTQAQAERFVVAFVTARELTRMQRRDGWLGSSAVYIRMLLEREPDLSPVLWPALKLAMSENPSLPAERLMLVEEAELVHRTRMYIIGEIPARRSELIQERTAA